MHKLIGLVAGIATAVSHAEAQIGNGGTVVDPNRVYFEFQVDKPARQTPNSARPRYPELLNKLRAEAEVQVQFVVDTFGVPDTASLKVLKSPHDLFVAAVRSALPNMRFVSAEVKGHKVKQMVRPRFTFAAPR